MKFKKLYENSEIHAISFDKQPLIILEGEVIVQMKKIANILIFEIINKNIMNIEDCLNEMDGINYDD